MTSVRNITDVTPVTKFLRTAQRALRDRNAL